MGARINMLPYSGSPKFIEDFADFVNWTLEMLYKVPVIGGALALAGVIFWHFLAYAMITWATVMVILLVMEVL